MAESTEEWSVDCECIVSEKSAQMNLKEVTKVWDEGALVEREIDGTWFAAKLVKFDSCGTFSVTYQDDGNSEEGIEAEEIRHPTPDGLYEYITAEVAAACALKLRDAENTEPEAGAAQSLCEMDLDLAAWEASETGSECSRPMTNTSSQGSDGSDWVVVDGGLIPGPPAEDAPHRKCGRSRGGMKALDRNVNVSDPLPASGSGLRALRALRKSRDACGDTAPRA